MSHFVSNLSCKSTYDNVVKVSGDATCWHSKLWRILLDFDQTGGPIWYFATGSLTPRKARRNAKPVRVIKLNFEGVRTHASLDNNQNTGELRPPRKYYFLLTDELRCSFLCRDEDYSFSIKSRTIKFLFYHTVRLAASWKKSKNFF